MPIPPIVTRTCVKVLRDTLPDVQAIYVFGSVASEQATDESDVDLAVLVPKPVDEEQRWELQGRLAKALGKDVDLIDLRSASAVLRVQVLSTGELLYDANPTLTAEFEAFALADYARLNEERAGILADVKARGSIYG
jgi:predicted nucleotidyltransferase